MQSERQITHLTVRVVSLTDAVAQAMDAVQHLAM
jgi:hypothetical protein